MHQTIEKPKKINDYRPTLVTLSTIIPPTLRKHYNLQPPSCTSPAYGAVASTCHSFIHSLVSIQPLGRFKQELEPSQATGMALAHCILGKFLGVGRHCFPPPLDVPTFSARCLHVQRRERPLGAEGGTLRGREMFRQISSRILMPYHAIITVF